MTNKKQFVTLGIMLCFFFLTAANVKTAAAQYDTPREGGIMRLAIINDMKRGFFPATTDEETKQVVGQIYSSLIEIDTDLSYIPDLATDWTISEDGLNYTFTLHPDAVFSDGEPVNADDVNFTILGVMRDYHPAGETAFGVIDDIDIVDDKTVQINLKYAFAPFMNFLGSFHACILPRHLWEGEDPLDSDYYYDPIGSGPFVLNEYEQGEYIILDKNPNYWKPGLPYLDRLVFQIISDPTVKMFSLERRDVDACLLYNDPYLVEDFMTPPASDSFATTFSGQEVLTGILHVDMNLAREPMSDPDFRMALATAIDNQQCLQIANNGFGIAVDTVFPVGIWHNDDTITTYPYDLDEAADMLDDAGYTVGVSGYREFPNGTPISLDIPSIVAAIDTFKSSEYVRDTLLSLDIQAQILSRDGATFTEEVFIDHNYDIHVVGWSYQMDPNIGIARFCTGGWQNVGWRNSCGYNNSVVNDLFDQAAKATNTTHRQSLFFEIQEILTEECVFVPLYQRASPSVYSREFHNVVTDATDFGAGFEETWWIGGTPVDYEEPEPVDISGLEDVVSDLNTEIDDLNDVVNDLSSEVEGLLAQLAMVTNLAYVILVVGIVLPVITIFILRPRE
jgi:peptide/nickel transport system substrate-binding protein